MVGYVAKPFVAGTSEAEVAGQAMIAFAENLESNAISRVLKKHDLETIDPEKWYPHQLWLDILKDFETDLAEASSQAFVAFGRSVAENALMPPDLKTIPDVLNALHAIHHANLRNIPEQEGFIIKKIGEQHFHIFENTPNPSDGIYGFIWGLAARFKAPGELFVVRTIENSTPDETPGTAFEVKWGTSKQDVA